MSNEAKHTPGPWHVCDDERTGKVTIESANDVTICEFQREENDEESFAAETADARLIAAAPELLAALRALVDSLDNGTGSGEELIEARAAIAKAEGKE